MNSYHLTVQLIVYLVLAVHALVTQNLKQRGIVSAQTANEGMFSSAWLKEDVK